MTSIGLDSSSDISFSRERWQHRGPLSSRQRNKSARVGHRIPPGSKHSRQIRASHGSGLATLSGRDGHLSSTCYAGDVAETPSNTQCACPTALEEMRWLCSSAEKSMCFELSLEAREGQNAQDKAERLMAATGHLLEDKMATCHPPGIAGEAAETVCLPTALEEISGGTSPARPQQCIHVHHC